MVVTLGDEQVAHAIEPQFVRHVERGRRRWSTVTAVSAFAAAGDRGQPLRGEVEPPDALVVEVAEVQAAVGSDHQTIGIVHLQIGVTRHTGADQRRHRRRRGAPTGRTQENRDEQRLCGHRLDGIFVEASRRMQALVQH